MNEKIEETLKKQLELLSKRSEDPNSDLSALTHAMIELVPFLVEPCNHSVIE